MLVKNEGGLCYELNSLFYLFLIENQFDAVLVRGVVYNHDKEQYETIGRTHVVILVSHKDTTYVIDTGFGGNLPLKPVPLSGEAVVSSNGEFRVKELDSPHGDYIFEMKLKYKHSEWRTGYAFDSGDPIKNVTQLNDIQTIIANHSDSPFNKHPLLTRRTDDGNVTLTDTSFTHWKDGEAYQIAVLFGNSEEFNGLTADTFMSSQETIRLGSQRDYQFMTKNMRSAHDHNTHNDTPSSPYKQNVLRRLLLSVRNLFV